MRAERCRVIKGVVAVVEDPEGGVARGPVCRRDTGEGGEECWVDKIFVEGEEEKGGEGEGGD